MSWEWNLLALRSSIEDDHRRRRAPGSGEPRRFGPRSTTLHLLHRLPRTTPSVEWGTDDQGLASCQLQESASATRTRDRSRPASAALALAAARARLATLCPPSPQPSNQQKLLWPGYVVHFQAFSLGSWIVGGNEEEGSVEDAFLFFFWLMLRYWRTEYMQSWYPWGGFVVKIRWVKKLNCWQRGLDQQDPSAHALYEMNWLRLKTGPILCQHYENNCTPWQYHHFGSMFP